MQIISLEFQNFNSYGNRVQRIDFPTDEAGFFLVCGENGAGKTSMKEAIEFILYGKVGGKKLKDLPNRTNGNLWGRIKLISKNKEIIVEAGLEPGLLNLWVDGKPYDKANKRGPREYLVEELLELPFHVFNNIVSISINDFKSFLKMSSDDKRKIVDKILGFQIINDMREVLKSQTKIIKDNLDSTLRTLDSAKRSLDSSLQQLESLIKKLQENSDDKIKESEENLGKFQSLLEMHNEKMTGFLNEERDLKTGVSKLSNQVYAFKNNVYDIENKLKLYSNQKCPTCQSDLNSAFHKTMRDDLESSLELAKRDLEKVQTLLIEIKEKESNMESEKRVFIEKESKIKHNIRTYTEILNQLKDGPKDEQLQYIKNIVSTMEEQTRVSNEEKNKDEEKVNWNKIIEEVLGEKGVKQMAVKTVLPSLNGEIYRLMTEMHLDFRVMFGEEFDATVTHLGQDISVATMSRGESKKVDFVVLMAMMKLMKIRFPSINLLFLDEIFEGLDADGIHSVLKILGKTIKELGLNTFVISHMQQFPNENFDFRIDVEKKNNFSNLSVGKI